MSSRIAGMLICWLALCATTVGCKSNKTGSDAVTKPSSLHQSAQQTVEPRAVAAPPAQPAAPQSPPEPAPAASAPSTPMDPRYADVDWPHLRIDLNNKVVEIAGYSGINEGWLEQIICLAGTRTHESVLITEAKPSHIHAALLLIGLEPGQPGWWKINPDDPEGMKWIVEPPKGAAVSITVEWASPQGETREVPVREWVRDYHTRELLPEGSWVFGGSQTRPDYTGKMTYVADRTGSIAGLVTFGDELLGWSEVLPDQEAVMAPEWQANTEAMPEFGTPVLIRLRPASEAR